MASINERVKLLREEKYLTVTELAAVVKKSEGAVRSWEMNRSKPDADTLIELAKYFECTTDYLLGLSNYKNEEEKENVLKSKEEQIDIFAQFSSGNKQKWFNLSKYILLDFSFADGMPKDSELFDRVVDFLQLLSVFYLTRYSYFEPEYYGDIRTREDKIETIVKSAIKLKNDIASLVMDIIEIGIEHEEFDYEEYQAMLHERNSVSNMKDDQPNIQEKSNENE